MGELLNNLGIDGRLLFAQAVNFLLVLWLLQRFVFKRLLSTLETRRQRIEQGLELTDKAEREMERIDQARKRELGLAKAKGEEVLNLAKSEAQAKHRELLLVTRKEAERVLLLAKAEAKKQKEDTVREAREEIQATSLLFAEKVLQRSFTKADQERLAKETLGELEKGHAK